MPLLRLELPSLLWSGVLHVPVVVFAGCTDVDHSCSSEKRNLSTLETLTEDRAPLLIKAIKPDLFGMHVVLDLVL